MKDKPILSFSSVTLKKIRKYFDVKVKYTKTPFNEWFSYEYIIPKEEKKRLDELIEIHQLKLTAYKEEKLKAKFIIPVLNLVRFFTDELDDWYETEIQAEFDHVILKGITDYLVATGSDDPEIPFFYLQEFKYSYPDKDPKYQLLAEMIAATAINPSDTMKGCFVVGALWYFTLLKKVEGKYEYYISSGYKALAPKELYQIFTYLQAVKAEALAVLEADSNK